jgi:membrane-bound inhibitor of C-type lysozyme
VLASGGAAFAASGPGAGTSTYQCAPLQQITVSPYPTGATYVADSAGIVSGVNPNDNTALLNGGCQLIGAGGSTICGELLNANMNVTTDQPMNWFVAPNQWYRLVKITALNASRSYASGAAAGGFYTAASKGGTAVVAATQAYTALTKTTATASLDLTLVSGAGTLGTWQNTPLYFALTAADGSAGTMDFIARCEIGQ